MVEAESQPQEYKLSSHEFQAFSGGKKTTYTFSLEVSNGKVVTGLKDSQVAQDLWEILQFSQKASELISSAGYQFSMDKQFVLHIQKNNN